MEIFKKVKGFSDYEVSNLGRVKSIARKIIYNDGSVRILKEKILKPNLTGSGYLKVSLCKEGKSKTRTNHQLVAESFLGHTPNGMKLVIDHINGVKTDNRLENLQIISQRENSSKNRKGSSKYTGVSLVKGRNKFRAQIVIDGKLINLGDFTDETKAAEAYQIALNNL